jgi:hypothetical protein
MWTEVVFEPAGPARGLELIARLSLDGLVLYQDFTWRYMPSLNEYQMKDSKPFENNVNRVIIGFRDPALATFYSLKWQR